MQVLVETGYRAGVLGKGTLGNGGKKSAASWNPLVGSPGQSGMDGASCDFSCLVDVTVCAENRGAWLAVHREHTWRGGCFSPPAAMRLGPITESERGACQGAALLYSRGRCLGPWRVRPLSSPGSAFSDAGQANLPRESDAAVGHVPPAVGNVLSLRRERGLTTGRRFPLFPEE